MEIILIRPDGTRNYTQEEIISFLGATTDDCGDALTSTVIYNANLSAISGFVCNDTTQVGANAFTCDYSINSQKTWFRNFTSSNQGQWFYQFKMDDPSVTSTSGTTNYIDITKDSTNLSYGGQGNGTTVIYLSQGKNLSVRVYDFDKGSYNVTGPSATVTFKLLHDSYADDEKIIGSAITNSSGYADFYFNMSDCSYIDGLQKWVGEINSSEPNYGSNISENFTITLQTTGCEATVDASNVLVPSEAFQNNLFKD